VVAFQRPSLKAFSGAPVAPCHFFERWGRAVFLEVVKVKRRTNHLNGLNHFHLVAG
jgi:hypothetical protein